MKYFVRVNTEGWVRGAFEFDLDVGPIEFPPCPPDESYVEVTVPFQWNPPTDHHEATMVDGTVVWMDTFPLKQHQEEAIEAIDAAGEALRLAVINRMPTQTEEYRRVEAQARAWALAGYPQDQVPRSVSSWAAAKHRDGWTSRQACDDILATADSWYEILDAIREKRLVRKEDVRHETDTAAIGAIVADMLADMRAMAGQLQLTITL